MKQLLLVLEINLEKAHMNISAQRYIEQAALRSAFVGIFAWLVAGLLLEEILFTIVYGIIIGLLTFAIILFLPVLKKKKIAQQVEAELPFSLMTIAAELNMRIPLEKTIKHASEQHTGILAQEWKRVLHEHTQKGVPLRTALFSFSERVDSQQVKRALIQLTQVLEQGKHQSGSTVKRIARDFLHKQQTEMKAYSGKMAVFSLLFIAVSAIIPAMFQSFVIVGSMILKLSLIISPIFYQTKSGHMMVLSFRVH